MKNACKIYLIICVMLFITITPFKVSHAEELYYKLVDDGNFYAPYKGNIYEVRLETSCIFKDMFEEFPNKEFNFRLTYVTEGVVVKKRGENKEYKQGDILKIKKGDEYTYHTTYTIQGRTLILPLGEINAKYMDDNKAEVESIKIPIVFEDGGKEKNDSIYIYYAKNDDSTHVYWIADGYDEYDIRFHGYEYTEKTMRFGDLSKVKMSINGKDVDVSSYLKGSTTIVSLLPEKTIEEDVGSENLSETPLEEPTDSLEKEEINKKDDSKKEYYTKEEFKIKDVETTNVKTSSTGRYEVVYEVEYYMKCRFFGDNLYKDMFKINPDEEHEIGLEVFDLNYDEYKLGFGNCKYDTLKKKLTGVNENSYIYLTSATPTHKYNLPSFYIKDVIEAADLLDTPQGYGHPEGLIEQMNPEDETSLAGKIIKNSSTFAAILLYIAIVTLGINLIINRNKAEERTSSMNGLTYICIGVILFTSILIIYNIVFNMVGENPKLGESEIIREIK